MSELRRSSRAVIAAHVSGVRLYPLALASLLSGCLVTNKVDYDQLVIASRVKRVDPPTEFLPLPVQPDPACKPMGMGHVRFAVEISDLNLEEELRLRVVVNKEIIREFEIAPNGEELRELDPPFFCVEAAFLTRPCNLVEAVVASSFRGVNFDDPYDARLGERDLAFAHWWVIGKAEDNPSASYLDCPDARPDAGLP